MADPRDDLDPEHTPVSDDQPTSSVAPDMATADTAERFREFLATGDSVAPQLERSGDQVGPYRLLSLLGTGGFGSVWMAERREPFVQRVALKIVKAGMDSRSVVARFEQERQALAVMNHPNIAKVLDGGLTPQGRPYFAMELVKGEPITEFCDARRLGIKDRLRLFTRACEAVQHAHLKGVVHRDIKPSNILAFEVEGEEPSLKVIDFGVAKAMVQPLTDKTIFTETGQMIGTPAYMSPEQADPSSSDIDTRSDIYSLGALLYELVTGATPFDSQELRKRGYGEIQRILREEDPPSPSARLSTISTKNAELASRIEKARGVALRQLAHELRSELEWIPLKAMRKEPLNRYQTAIELANDVRAYLDGQPIVAAPESRLYRVRKYVRRHRGPVVAASLVSGALLVGLSVATWQWRAADLARGAAEEARIVAEQSREEAVEQRVEAEARRQQSLEEKRRADDLVSMIRSSAALDLIREGDLSRAQYEIAELKALGSERHFMSDLAEAAFESETRVGLGASRPLRFVAVSSEGSRVVAAELAESAVRCWSESAEGLVEASPLMHSASVTAAAFSRDSRRLATADGAGSLRVWDASSWAQIAELHDSQIGEVSAVRLSFDGGVIAYAGVSGQVIVASGADWSEKRRFSGRFEGSVQSLAISPASDLIAIGEIDGGIRLLRAWRDSRAEVEIYAGGAVNCLAFSAEGDYLACGTDAGELRVWSIRVDSPRLVFLSQCEFEPTAVSFGIDGRSVLVASKEAAVRACALPSGKWMRDQAFPGTRGGAMAGFSESGRRLVAMSTGDEPTVHLWDLANMWERRLTVDGLTCFCFIDDLELIASGHTDGSIRLWDLRSGLPLGTEAGQPVLDDRPESSYRGSFGFDPASMRAVVYGPATKGIYCLDAGGAVERRAASVGWSVAAISNELGRLTCISPVNGGAAVAVGRDDGAVLLLDPLDLSPLSKVVHGPGGVTGIACLGATDRFVSVGQDGELVTWQIGAGSQIQEIRRDRISRQLDSVCCSRDARFAAVCDRGKVTVFEFEVSEGRLVPSFGGVDAVSVAFTPDSRALVLATKSGEVCVRELSTLSELVRPLAFGRSASRPCSVAFASDGEMLAVTDSAGSLRIWLSERPSLRRPAIDSRFAELEDARIRLADRLVGARRSGWRLGLLQRDVVSQSVSETWKRTESLAIGEALQRYGCLVLEQLDRLDELQGDFEDRHDNQAALDYIVDLAESEKELLDELDPQNAAAWWAYIARAGRCGVRAGAPVRDRAILMNLAEHAVTLTGGENHDHIAVLAEVCFELGETERALAIQKKSFEEALDKLGPADDVTRRASTTYGSLLRKSGRPSDALKVLGLVANNRMQHRDKREVALAELAVSVDSARFSTAEPVLRNSYSPWLERCDEIDCLLDLIDFYTAWNTAEPGKGYDLKAGDWRAKLEAQIHLSGAQ